MSKDMHPSNLGESLQHNSGGALEKMIVQDPFPEQTQTTVETTEQNSKPPSIAVIDIETWATSPDAEIRSIGAVILGGTEFFYTEPAAQYDRDATAKTSEWAEKNILKELAPSKRSACSLRDTLTSLTDWIKRNNVQQFYCRGKDFDPVILSNAYNQQLMDTPWEYYQWHCIRDLEAFTGMKPPTKYRTHHALIDAIEEAIHLKELLNVKRNVFGR